LWNKTFAPVDPSTSKSRSGWIIFYAGRPVSWASKLQSQVALSTTEAEYIAMSQSLRDIIPIMGLLQEMREQNFMSCAPSPMCTARILKTILAPSNWQGYLNFALEPGTLTYATIIFTNMYARDSSRSSLWTPRTRLLTHSPNPWHKMTFNVIVASCVTSDLHKQPKWGSVMY
jgi:hypothetical protein